MRTIAKGRPAGFIYTASNMYVVFARVMLGRKNAVAGSKKDSRVTGVSSRASSPVSQAPPLFELPQCSGVLLGSPRHISRAGDICTVGGWMSGKSRRRD